MRPIKNKIDYTPLVELSLTLTDEIFRDISQLIMYTCPMSYQHIYKIVILHKIYACILKSEEK